MAKPNLNQILEDMQLKLTQCAIKEAEAKMEKAKVELETARLQQDHIRRLIEVESTNARRWYH